MLSVLLRIQKNMSSIRCCRLRGSRRKSSSSVGRVAASLYGPAAMVPMEEQSASFLSYHASFIIVQLSFYWCVGVVRGWIEELRGSCTENVIESGGIGTHKMERFVAESKCHIWLISPQSVKGAWSK